MAVDKAAEQRKADLVRQAAAIKEEVLSQDALSALLKVTADDLVGPNPESEVIKGGAHRSGGWLHAPAHLELFAAADRRLTRVANWAGMTVRQVERVHARMVRNTKLVVLQAASPDDLTAIPVNRYDTSSAWINLIQLLGEAGLVVATGYREKYDVAFVPRGSALWPGLVIDLGQPLERRVEPGSRRKKKDKAAANNGATAARADTRKAEAAKPEAAKPEAPKGEASGAGTPQG